MDSHKRQTPQCTHGRECQKLFQLWHFEMPQTLHQKNVNSQWATGNSMSHSGDYYNLSASVTIIGLLWWKDTDFLNVSARKELKIKAQSLHLTSQESTLELCRPLTKRTCPERYGRHPPSCREGQNMSCRWWQYRSSQRPGWSGLARSQKFWLWPVPSASRKKKIAPFYCHLSSAETLVSPEFWMVLAHSRYQSRIVWFRRVDTLPLK